MPSVGFERCMNGRAVTNAMPTPRASSPANTNTLRLRSLNNATAPATTVGFPVMQRSSVLLKNRTLSVPAQFGNTVMGSYAYLGQENLAALGEFLAASKGTK